MLYKCIPLEKSTNNCAALKFFVGNPLMTPQIIRICKIVDRFLR